MKPDAMKGKQSFTNLIQGWPEVIVPGIELAVVVDEVIPSAVVIVPHHADEVQVTAN